MIHRVHCDKESFREVTFTSGFNVVLADRTKEATKKDTRNGLGKSTLIEIIHFCLGSNAPKDGLGSEALKGWVFSLDLEIQEKQMSVSRDTASPSRIVIEGDTQDLPIQPRYNKKTKALELKTKEWTENLGALIFGLPVEAAREPYSPTFRGLFSYFSRRGRDAYSIPFEHYRKQKEVDKQVYNSFLLGLDWDYAREWQVLKDKKKVLEGLKIAARTGLMNSIVGSRGELDALRVRLRTALDESQAQLASFRVHPQYRDIEESANALTRAIHDLSNQSLADTRLLEYYESSISGEKPPDGREVDLVYKEAGVVLPDLVKRRLDDVKAFHTSVVQNRKSFLKREIDRLQRSVEAARREIENKSEERAKLLEILSTHGALEEYNRLQQRNTELSSQLADTEQRIKNLRDFEEGKSALAIDQQLLQQRARQDLDDRHEVTDRAISLFNANSEALYEAPGSLVIDLQDTGYKFNVEIERSGSQGIDSMKVFCYDLMLAQLWSQKTPSPKLLIHDSTVFDGVDERQVALALERAASESEGSVFQYICTLNSDTLPTDDFSDEFDINDFVRLRLTDATEDGCLLGVRF